MRKVITCYAGKQCGMNKFARRVNEAAGQLLNYKPAGATLKKVVLVSCTDGTDAEWSDAQAKW